MNITSPRFLKYTAIVSVIVGLSIIVVFAILLLGGNYQFSGYNLNDDSLDITYKVGGFIGSIVGPIWALAGIFLYYAALSYQKDDIKKSQEAFEIQSFENTFFSLIETQRDITQNLTGSFKLVRNYEQHDILVKGNEYFKYAIGQLCHIYVILGMDKDEDYPGILDERYAANLKQQRSDNPDGHFDYIGIEKDQYNLQQHASIDKYKISKAQWDKRNTFNNSQKIMLSYKYFFIAHQHEIGHYFRHLYNILKFIESSEKKFKGREIDHAKYANFVQAQMSSYELALSYYNIMFFPKAQRLVKKFDILENLAKEDLVMKQDFQELTKIPVGTREGIFEPFEI